MAHLGHPHGNELSAFTFMLMEHFIIFKYFQHPFSGRRSGNFNSNTLYKNDVKYQIIPIPNFIEIRQSGAEITMRDLRIRVELKNRIKKHMTVIHKD